MKLYFNIILITTNYTNHEWYGVWKNKAKAAVHLKNVNLKADAYFLYLTVFKLIIAILSNSKKSFDCTFKIEFKHLIQTYTFKLHLITKYHYKISLKKFELKIIELKDFIKYLKSKLLKYFLENLQKRQNLIKSLQSWL